MSEHVMRTSNNHKHISRGAGTIVGAALLLLLPACSWIGPEKEWNNPFDVPDVVVEKCTPVLDSVTGLKQLNVAQEMVLTAFATCNTSSVTRSVWSFGKGTSWDTAAGLIGKHRFSIDDTGTQTVRVMVITAAGEISEPFSLTVSVNSSRPYIVNEIADTLVGQHASITRALLAADQDGSIVKYYWSTGETGWSDSAATSTGAVVAVAKPSGGVVRVRWSAIDNDGLDVVDTFLVTFNRGPDSIKVTKPAITREVPFDSYDVATNSGVVTMRFHAVDPDSADKITYTVVVKYGAADTALMYKGGDTVVTIKKVAASQVLQWNIIAKDAFGDSVTAQGSFTTARAPSSPEGMVLIPGGPNHFCNMGQSGFDSSEHPIHPVVFSNSFLIDSTEVTCAEYYKITGKGDSSTEAARLPVVNVTWYDALLYCNARSRSKGIDTVYRYTLAKTDTSGKVIRLENLAADFSVTGYRLPTEAEWEYACKRDSMTLFFWGNAQSLAATYSWTRENSGNTVHPVASRLASVTGLYDMAGNVWEWCYDWFDPKYYTVSPQKDPKGPESGTQRVIRGGSYRHTLYFAQAGTRSQLDPGASNQFTGFRTILSVK